MTQGFIGSDLSDDTTTLGREGSDYSATLIGEAIDAYRVEIWTDVPGVASADPRIVADAQFIKNLSFDEATALASLGAKVLFPSTLFPAKRKNIPVVVGSSLNPSLGGTVISNQENKEFSLKAISLLAMEQDLILSFVGTNLGLKNDLAKILKNDLESLCKIEFCIYQSTSYALSFKVTFNKNQDFNQALLVKQAHQVLLNFCFDK